MTLALMIEINPLVMLLIKYLNITLTILLLIIVYNYIANVVIHLCYDRNIDHYPLLLYSHEELRDFRKAL